MRKATALTTALLMASAAQSSFAVNNTPTSEEMWEIIQQQAEQIEKLKGQQQETDVKVEATADAVEANSGLSGWAAKTQLGGYGEVLYNNGTTSSDSKEVDVQRFVLFVGHQFNDNLRFFSELEVEHTNTARSGEVELEQAYIEWDYAKNHSVLAGLHLVPIGILNETHEPETFYGVERNRIESRIIPTTYRVNGIKFAGEIAEGLSYDLALHEGLELADNLSIRSSRQGGSRADAEELAGTARLKYTGVKGLELGLALHYQSDLGLDGNVELGDTDLTADLDALLTEAHVIYENGPFGLRALYAQWDIDNDIEDLSFPVTSDGVTNTVTGTGRDKQEGYYLETSYKLTEKLGTFIRYESVDERAGDNSSDSEERRTLIGANYWIHPNVVVKADIQFENDEDTNSSNELDGFNLGVGWSF